MSKEIININDGKIRSMNDDLSIKSNLKGEVSVYDKTDTDLALIRERHNLIVYGGREWLLRRAFTNSIRGATEKDYNGQINWFGAGQGGGEPGTPLQAGTTKGSDTSLKSMIRLRDDLQDGDPGYNLYASNSLTGDLGYYKKFSTVTIKQDTANPYMDDGVVKYPPLIAEIRIELSSSDANGSGSIDLNEAALFISDNDIDDPGKTYYDYSNESSSSSDDSIILSEDVKQIIIDGDYIVYILDTNDLDDGVNIGDTLWTSRSDVSDGNGVISPTVGGLISDVYCGETGRNAYIVVQNSIGAVDEDFGSGPYVLTANVEDRIIEPYTMFSRVTFSTIRKTVDRELVFLWKIYF